MIKCSLQQLFVDAGPNKYIICLLRCCYMVRNTYKVAISVLTDEKSQLAITTHLDPFHGWQRQRQRQTAVPSPYC